MKVLTLNVWGLNKVSKFRNKRIKAIASKLIDINVDIICLQELWLNDDFEYMKNFLMSFYPFNKYFYSGVVGSGLAIFSKYPFLDSDFINYNMNGPPLEVIKGDWFAGKGVGWVTINHPSYGLIDVYTTHFHSAYSENDKYSRFAHRINQSWQLSTLVNRSHASNKSVIVTGDLNSEPFTLVFDLLKTHSQLQDSWALTHPNHDKFGARGQNDAVFRCGFTADSALNSFHRHRYPIPPNIPLDIDRIEYAGGKRLDYILFRSSTLKIQECNIDFHEYCPPNFNFSYSDHFGIVATFKPNDEATASPTKTNTSDNLTCYKESITALEKLAKHSYHQSLKYLLFTFSLILFAIALIVGCTFTPTSRYSPIFTFFSFLAGAAGATYLYVGFIFGRFEKHNIQNLIEQIDDFIKTK